MLDYSLLSNNFTKITDYKKSIVSVLFHIKQKNDSLVDIYDEYCNLNSDSFNIKTLDTFKFQNKLMLIEYESNTKIYNIFMNRMYGDYYKLFIDINKYCSSSVQKLKMNVSTDYEVYKDLEIEKEYSFDTITDLYSEMLSILTDLDNYINNENRNIKEYQLNKKNGINISSFVLDKEYSLNTLENKNKMFYNTLFEFTNFQIKTLRRILLKLRVSYTQINSDINLENDIYKKDKKGDLNEQKISKINNRSISFNLKEKLMTENNENNSDSDNSKIENLINDEINKIFSESNESNESNESPDRKIRQFENLEVSKNESSDINSLYSIDLSEIREEELEEKNRKLEEKELEKNRKLDNKIMVNPRRITNKLITGGFFLPLF